MESETIRILKMLEEGKISSEEAVRLIEALKHEKPGNTETWASGRKSRIWRDFGFEWDNLRNIGQYLNECFGPKSEFAEEKEWSFDAQRISTIDAESINGNITVTGSEKDQIIVKARKIVKAQSDAIAEEIDEQVNIIAQQVENRLQILTEQPMTLFNASVTVHYDIFCPGTMNINLLSKNGKISVNQIEGVLKLATINGKILLESISGSANAKTTNGKIYASLKDLKSDIKLSSLNGSIETHILSGNASIALKTMNGSIRLYLPDDFSGHLDAEVKFGKIHSDFPITTQNFNRRHLTGQIGSHNETPIFLSTKNGNIYINKPNPAEPESN